ncbi:glycosyltransferase family 4 protein [Moorena sp. SIO4G3]|uniref:glycosyltransferase family 4 protein n=1 Tax=Moorena sp. SIO4G3 TaxID=2607821 RepID=UPI00142A8FBF|nr:glycosyltransferase family 4 protein [Moorena sp. SIO4G3]NEO79666.1 glycosyltransferase family 4 protein [Moorena sp. SIO4G3]
MKIALLTNGIYPYVIGGMQKHSYYLAKYLAKNSIYVTVYHYLSNTEHTGLQKLFSDEEYQYIQLITVDFPKLKKIPGHYLIACYLYSKNIFNAIDNINSFDFIYIQGFSGWKLLQAHKNGLNTPPIGVNFHGLEMFQKSLTLREKFERFMFRPFVINNLNSADICLSLGGNLSNIIYSIGINSNKINQIANGIENTWISPIVKPIYRPIKFLFVGRYERRKGIEELYIVINKLLPEFEFEFNFVGSIPEYLQIKSPRVTYWGLIKDVEKLQSIFQQCDVLVCPSHSEGMPTVILEAMASGLAVIATDVGAVSEMVSEQNGWLISPGSTHQLREALINAIHASDEELTNKKIKSQSIVREHFTWDKVIKKTIATIESVI